MSLMNDMLRDLEKRQAPDRTQQVEAQGYGALTQQTDNDSSRAVILLLGIIIVMLVGLAIGWWYIQATSQTNHGSEIAGALVVNNDASAEGSVVGRVGRATEQALVTMDSPASEPALSSGAVKVPPATASRSDVELPLSNGAQPNELLEQKNVSQKSNVQASPVSQDDIPVEKASAKLPEKTPLAEPPSEEAKVVKAMPEARAQKAPVKTKVAQNTVIDRPKSETVALSRVLVVSPEQRDEQMVDSAERLVNAGKGQDAKTQLMAFIDKYDVDVKSRALLASLLMQDGNMAGANALLTDDKVAQSSHLRRLKAHWLAQGRQPDEAIALLNSARPDIASDPEYHVLLAALYQQQGFSSEAVATYAELLSYNPNMADWWVGMGIALDSSQQYPSAKKAYEKALTMEGLRYELADFAKQRLATLGG